MTGTSALWTSISERPYPENVHGCWSYLKSIFNLCILHKLFYLLRLKTKENRCFVLFCTCWEYSFMRYQYCTVRRCNLIYNSFEDWVSFHSAFNIQQVTNILVFFPLKQRLSRSRISCILLTFVILCELTFQLTTRLKYHHGHFFDWVLQNEHTSQTISEQKCHHNTAIGLITMKKESKQNLHCKKWLREFNILLHVNTNSICRFFIYLVYNILTILCCKNRYRGRLFIYASILEKHLWVKSNRLYTRVLIAFITISSNI